MAGFSWQCHAGRFAHSMVVGTMALRPHGSNALPLDLDLSLTGCDLLALPQGSHQARLSYWRFFGSGSMEVVNNTLRVRATNQRKILMLRCTLVLYLPSYEGDGHYNSAKISILPDHSEREETCSNTVQMLSISLFSLRLRKELEMNISTVARTELKQVSTPSLKVRLHGGSFRLRSSAMPKVRLVAKDAMVHMTADGPVEVHLDDEDTFAQVALAAPSVQTGSSTHTKAKAPARNFSTWYHLSGAKAAPHTVLDLRSRGSMIYVQASEDPGAVERSCALQVVRGDGATEKAVLLPHTKKLLSHVQRWVERAKAREEHRYIIYIHLLAPNAPVGMLELLSSPIYEAISLSTASLISGGMLQPNIQRIVAPVGGMNWLFPEDPCSPQQERSMRFAQAVLDAVSLEVDVNKMNMTSTRWLWNAKGDAAYTFQWVEAHDEAFWRPKLVTVQDVLPFLTAASITLTLSFASGILVVLLIILRVIPALRSELQRVQIMNTASYRVDAKQSWALSPTMVHWPTRGVLLRWGPRANALQFRSMRFSARLWPDGKTEEGCKGVVKTKRIPLTKLPVYPDLPNQSCFLFVADVRDVESMRSFKHHAHNAQLMELGIMQADKEQLPLKSGRPYQFQVTAYGGNGEVLGVSAWSMPTMIDPGRSFSELPLLLWRGLCGLLPSSSFGHFLKEHCVVFPEEPAMVVKFKKIRLSILGNAELLHSNGQKRQVQLYFSTSGKEPKVTEPVALSEKEQKRQRTAVPKAERKAEDRILTFPSEISLNVSNDLTEKLTVEVSLISQEGEEKMIAKWQHSWSHLLDLMRYSRSEDLTEVVLRAGLLPVAIFSAKFEISNTMLASTARPLIPKKNVPEIFAQIRPGATIFWGETVKLEWPVSAGVEDLGALEISIVSTKLNLEKLYHGLVAEAPMGPALPSILQRVQCASGQAALELCPQGEGMMACYLQARTTGSDSQVVACSGQFLVARPVLLQDLELCYAGFCARNGIPMERVDGNSEIVMVERFFHVISGFRAPFPVPLERKAVAESHHSLVLVENPTSCAIVAEAPVKLSNPEEKQARQRSTSKMSTAQASVKSMEQPLLMASASEADEEEKDMEQKLRIVVPHRQAMKIPMNVFWRSDGEWLRDPLLWYRFLPFESLGCATARGFRGFRALLLTLLFYGQIVAIVIPVLLVFALAVCHDGVHATVRADLLRRDAGEHFYLLDFIMAPSAFRFWRLDPELQMFQGAAVLYLLLIGATLSYCMVLRFNKNFKPAEMFFSYADGLIKNVTYVLLTLFILFATNTLMWVVLGSLIRPQDLIPYAIMVGMAATVSQSMLTKFNGMQTHCSSRLSGLLDKALFAIFKVMSKDQSAKHNFQQEETKFLQLQMDVWKKLPKLEVAEAQKMLQMVRKNRQGPEVEEFLSSLSLVPASDQSESPEGEARTAAEADEAQKVAQEFKNDKKEDQEKKVKALAKSLSLHSDTVRFIMSCFEGFVVMKRLRSDSAAHSNSSVETMASLMAAARRECLFLHFIGADLNGADPKEASEETPETEPRVLSLLSHLQNEEMEKMESVLARCLSQCLDWGKIIKEAEQFWTEGLKGVVLDAVERQLSPVIQSSTASQVVLAAYQLGYVYFEQRYRTSPLEIFVDCGIVSQEEMQNPQVQFILIAMVDAHLNGCDPNPRALIQAVRSLILPDEKMALDVSGEPKAYFCFATLVAVLKDLGWSKDELQREYLMKTWRDVTEGVCLFEYGNTHELATLVLQFSNRGLWKAAAKCLLLKIGVGGYAGCEEATKSAQEAGELATELQAGDILNIRMVKDKCRWPQDVKDIWNGIAVPARAVPSPSFLPTDSLPDFLEALVYVPPSEELTIEASKLVPLAPFADAMEDLAWHRGPDRAIWHVRPSGPRKLRGLWLELVLQVFESMECIPSDLDLFFQCKEWAAATLPETRSSSPRQALEKAPCGSSFMLRLVTLKSWLKRVYLAKLKDCTFHQFQVIVQHMLKCSIPEKALYEEVFLKCPKIPEDDKGELRAVSDLGASLFVYTNHGVWPEALSQVARRILGTGPIRDYTLQNLEEAFAEMDSKKRGVLEAPEALQLLQVLATPGLTCSDLSHMLENELGLHVPKPELQRYFAMMDINNDGVLQCEEFVQMIRFLMLDFYPHHILKHLNLTLRQITGFVLMILAGIGLIFFLVTLVVGLFKTGASLDSLLHSGFVGTFGVVGKRLSDQGIGFEDTMQNLEVKLEAMLGSALVLVLGLSKEMEEVFMGVLKEVESAF